MKLKYNKTRWLSTADLNIAIDPPILFEVKTSVTAEWANIELVWEEKGGESLEVAYQLIAEAFLTVAQGDNKYPLSSKEDAISLRDAIEESCPGEGDTFIRHLLMAFTQRHFRFLVENSAASGILLPPSNGTASPSALKTAKAKA